MKFEELLKAQGLSEEQITSITGAMTKEKIYTTSLENADDRYSKLKGQKENLEGELNTANTTIADLKKASKGNEELQNKIKEHEATISTMKTENDAKIRNLTIDSAIDKALIGAKHSDLLKGQFDREKLVVGEDGTIQGFDEQLTILKETYKDFFEEKLTGNPPANNGGSKGDTDPFLQGFDEAFN